MKKIILLSLTLLIFLPLLSALNLNIEKKSSNEVLIYDLKKPAVLELEIKNNGPDNTLRFYNLVGFELTPQYVDIKKDETKTIKLSVFPIGEITQRGGYSFEYFIRGKDGDEIKKTMVFRITDLKDAFEIGADDVVPESSSINLYVHNKINYEFKKINVKFSSPFFEEDKDFSLGPNKRQDFLVKINKNDFKKLTAGFYTFTAEISVDDVTAELEETIRFVEKNIVTETSSELGFIVNTKTIKKINEGNAVAEVSASVQKNIISRLFTTFSPEPNAVKRQSWKVYYSWKQEIKPGETFEIKAKTNWLFPFIIILFLIVIVILAKQYTKTNLVLKKRVNFVRAKGGEFALKVTISIHSRKYIEKVNIIDRLPPLVKLYEKFGMEKPTRIDEKNKRIEWNFQKLEAGEVRVLNYILYSKVGVLGKFALPSATAIYEKDGNIEEAQSNRAFLVAEQGGD